MIELIPGESLVEAQRIQAGLQCAGIHADIAEEASTQPGQVLLADLGKLRQQPQLSKLHSVIAFGGDNSAAAAREAFGYGAIDYLPQGCDLDEFTQAANRLVSMGVQNEAQLSDNPRMQQLYEQAARVARTDVAVLISGPSGAGKEVVARYIHQQSNRSHAPYIAINCAAIPESILEATLFGHTKGAFTGATDARPGKFEQAAGGTLLLDEITEMPVALQSKLLRVLQEKEVERLGSNRTQAVDVRVIAATNRDPKQAIADGLLREDLYFRLSVFPLQIPSLVERPEDILPLAQEFLRHYGGAGQTLSPAAQARLQSYAWPGNVRELENCIQRAIVLTDSLTIQADDLGIESVVDSTDPSLAQQVKSKEEEILLQRLAANKGVRKATAQELGISERTLRHKLQSLRARGVLF